MKTLYDMERSGNCYKIRLFMSLTGEAYERIPVDLPGGENRTDSFLALNPRGEIPVLVDGDVTLWDSCAILIYLASVSAEPARWFPEDPVQRARVAQWLAVAGHEIHYGLAAARAIKQFGRAGDFALAQETGHKALALLDRQLAITPWLAGDNPTLADIACYPYVFTAGDGDIDVTPHPHVCQWMQRIESLPGYTPMFSG